MVRTTNRSVVLIMNYYCFNSESKSPIDSGDPHLHGSACPFSTLAPPTVANEHNMQIMSFTDWTFTNQSLKIE